MSWFLIAVTIVTGWTWAALRLHAGWAPPPEPPPAPLRPDVQKLLEATQRAGEAMRRFGMSMQQFAAAMQEANRPRAGGSR